MTQFEIICGVEKISEAYLIPVLEELLDAFPFRIIYLNFHRPCYFAEIKIDAKGKEKKTYPYRCIMTPYEKLKSLPNATSHLKEAISFVVLDKQMLAMTDLQAAKCMKLAQPELFREIFKAPS